MSYARMLKAAGVVEQTKDAVVEYAHECAILRVEPNEEKSEKLIKRFVAAQTSYHQAFVEDAE